MMIQRPAVSLSPSGMAVLAIITTKRKGMLERISISLCTIKSKAPPKKAHKKANRDAEGIDQRNIDQGGLEVYLQAAKEVSKNIVALGTRSKQVSLTFSHGRRGRREMNLPEPARF